MPNLIVGLFAAIMLVGINAGAAQASTTVYSGACSNTSASGSNWWVADYGVGPYSSVTSIPSITTVYPDCTAGTYYRLYPTQSGAYTNYYPESFINSSMYSSTIGGVYSCTACADGYELYTRTDAINYGSSEIVSCTSIINLTVKGCKATSTSGGDSGSTGTCSTSTCADDTTWTTVNTTYVKRTKRACSSDNTTCNETVIYACNQGYFGNSGSTSQSGCIPCPTYTQSGITYSTTTNTVAAGAVSACYIVAEEGVTEFFDDTGTYVMTPYSNPTEYCRYSLGNCASYTGVCSTTSGTSYAVVSGTKTNSTSGTYCWCNANGKSFMTANMNNTTACTNNCKTSCNTAFFGFSANSYTSMVSLDDLGC